MLFESRKFTVTKTQLAYSIQTLDRDIFVEQEVPHPLTEQRAANFRLLANQ